MPKPFSLSVSTTSGQGAGRPGPPGPPGESASLARFSFAVANNAALNAIPDEARLEGMIVYSQQIQCYYELGPDLMTWVFKDSNPALASQVAWYVDPTGSDDNDGKTLGTALATLTELAGRLWPRGRKQNLTNDVTVFVNTASPSTFNFPQLVMNVGTDEPLVGGIGFHVFNVVAGKVSSSPITLSADAVIPIASTNQRGQLATASGTFVADEMIEITSGPGIGGVGYSNGLNGDAQHTFVTALTVPTIAGTVLNGGHGQDIKPLAGDTCVVTTLVTQITRLEITCTGFARVFVQYAKITRLSVNGESASSPYAGIGGPVLVSCCQQISAGGRWENNCGGAFLLQCRTPRAHFTSLYGTGWCLIGHALQGIMSLNGQALSYGLNIDGGQLKVGMGDDNNHPSESVPSKWIVFTCYTNLFTGGSSGGIEFTNGSLISGSTIYNSGAIIVCENSELQNSDNNTYLWGATTSLYDFGIIVMANARAVQGNVSLGVIETVWKIPSAVNMIVDNLFFAFSDNTVALKNSNCGLIGSNYNIANNYNETDSGFYLRNQSANIGPTAFSQIKKPGMYKVFGYVSVTTADGAASGAPVLNVTWTDDSGVAQTRAVATGPSMTTLGGGGDEVIIECGPSLALVTWSITGVVSAGSAPAKFSVRMRVEKDCFGG
jgi:hypothetical protein